MELQAFVEFAQGDDGIAMRIIEGIVEIDEEVIIMLHFLSFGQI
jgi:hypothetical protein